MSDKIKPKYIDGEHVCSGAQNCPFWQGSGDARGRKACSISPEGYAQYDKPCIPALRRDRDMHISLNNDLVKRLGVSKQENAQLREQIGIVQELAERYKSERDEKDKSIYEYQKKVCILESLLGYGDGKPMSEGKMTDETKPRSIEKCILQLERVGCSGLDVRKNELINWLAIITHLREQIGIVQEMYEQCKKERDEDNK